MKKAVLAVVIVVAVAGIAWGVYLWTGKKEAEPEVKPMTNKEQAALLDQMVASSTPAPANQAAQLDAMLAPDRTTTPADRYQERLLLDSMIRK